MTISFHVGIFCLCRQRVDNRADLSDFEICNRYNIDNTGLVCKFLLSSSSQLTSTDSKVTGTVDICIKYFHQCWLRFCEWFALFYCQPIENKILNCGCNCDCVSVLDIAESYGQMQLMQPQLWMRRLQKPWHCGQNHGRKLFFKTLVESIRFSMFQNKVIHELQACCHLSK